MRSQYVVFVVALHLFLKFGFTSMFLLLATSAYCFGSIFCGCTFTSGIVVSNPFNAPFLPQQQQ